MWSRRSFNKKINNTIHSQASSSSTSSNSSVASKPIEEFSQNIIIQSRCIAGILNFLVKPIVPKRPINLDEENFPRGEFEGFGTCKLHDCAGLDEENDYEKLFKIGKKLGEMGLLESDVLAMGLAILLYIRSKLGVWYDKSEKMRDTWCKSYAFISIPLLKGMA
eukprot:Awhi_evm1s11543